MSQDALKQLGFTDKEIVVYTTLLEHNTLTPHEIAKLTGINRTTIYSTAKELTKKGILTEDLGNTTRRFIALPPKNLEIIFKKEQKKLEDKKLYTMRAIRELSIFTQESKYSVPKIVFVEEDGVLDHLYRQTPLWNKSIIDTNTEYWGYQDASFVKQYESWIDDYWAKESTSHNIILKLLSNEKAEQIKKKKYSNRHIRFWNKTNDFTATTWIMGDYVTMIVTNQRPHYLVEIHDKTLAHNMREVFKGLWEELFEE